MKKFILFLVLVIPLTMQAQDTGLHFEHSTWKEIQAKAKANEVLLYYTRTYSFVQFEF